MRQPLEPFGLSEGASDHDEITIKVETADGDLLYRQANNFGLGDSTYAFNLTNTSRSGQIMKRGEYLFAVDEEGQVLKRLSWPRSKNDQGLSHELYGWAVFYLTQLDNGFTDSIIDRVKYLIWVTVEAWHMDTRDDSSPDSTFGELCDRAIGLTIYRSPECGFEKLHRSSGLVDNLTLKDDLVVRAHQRSDFEIAKLCGRLDELCQVFQDEVFFNGMRDILDKCQGGASGEFGNVEILCVEMCQYQRIMLQGNESWISFQVRPEAKSLYVLGVHGTIPQIRDLVWTAVRAWNSEPSQRSNFRADSSIRAI